MLLSVAEVSQSGTFEAFVIINVLGVGPSSKSPLKGGLTPHKQSS